jgi:energy-coupling factor transport system ATP-binding protein
MVYLDDTTNTTLSGPPREILRQIDLTPPLVTLGKALDWEPLPLTIKEGRRFAREASNVKRKTLNVKRHSSFNVHHSTFAVRNLQFAYNGKPVLRGVDLKIAPGELVALMGRNGSGKTTLLKCVVGLLEPRGGEIELDGDSLLGQETADICQEIGYLPQDPSDLLFADTVAEELAITLRNHHLTDDPPVAPDALLDRLGLGEVAASYPRDLSAGQRQRAALGAVTVTQPRLLLLDEPTRGLDYPAKRELVRLLEEWKTEGAGILLVTHDVELVAQAADRVMLLSQGEIIANDAPEMLTASPLFSPQVARLFPHSGWLTAEDAMEGLKRQT